MSEETTNGQTGEGQGENNISTPPVTPQATDPPVGDASPPAGDQEGQQENEWTPPSQSEFEAMTLQLQQSQKQIRDIEKSQKDREKAEAEKKGEFEKLYKEEQEKRESAEADLRKQKLWLDQREAAQKVGIPESFASRLVGETLDELVTDAKAIKKELPAPKAPNTSSGGGEGSVPSSQGSDYLGGLTPEEFAARFNLDPASVKAVIQ